MAAKKTQEEKLAEQIGTAVENHWFNPALFAHLMVKGNPLYTLDNLMELIKHTLKYMDQRYKDEWEHGQTSAGLMMASYLADCLDIKENPDNHIG